jgi:hypothetical protein
MSRLIPALMGLFLIAPFAAAQAKIDIPAQHYKVRQEIHAKVQNFGIRPVTICVEFGQTSPKADGETESTPSPFWVQRNSDGKWGTLIIGPDVGSMRAAVLLDAGESKEFSIRLNDSGRMRLRLDYWPRPISNLDCHAPPKGSKRVTSAVFTVE